MLVDILVDILMDILANILMNIRVNIWMDILTQYPLHRCQADEEPEDSIRLWESGASTLDLGHPPIRFVWC